MVGLVNQLLESAGLGVRQMVHGHMPEPPRAPAKPPADPLAALPMARKKLASLRNDMHEARGVAASFNERMNDLYARVSQATSNLQYLERSAPEGDPAIGAARGRLQDAKELRDELAPRAASAQEVFEASGELVRRCDELVTTPGIRLAEANHATPAKTPKGLAEAIETTRRKIREHRADIQTVECSPWPADTAKAAAAAQIDALARAPDVGALIDARGGKIAWPGSYLGDERDVFGLMMWLHRDELVAAVHREIQLIADDKHALSDAQRATKLRDLAADMLLLEREEEGLVELAHGDGLRVNRRADADPYAVLGVTCK